MDELLNTALLPVLRSHKTGDPIMTFKSPNKLSVDDICEYELVLHHLVRYYPCMSMLPANLRDGLIKLDSKLKISGTNGPMDQWNWCTTQATIISSLLQYAMRFVRREGISDSMPVNRLKGIYRDVLELRKAERGGEEEPCDASDEQAEHVEGIEYVASSQEAGEPPGAAPPLLGEPEHVADKHDSTHDAVCAWLQLPSPALPNVPTFNQTPVALPAPPVEEPAAPVEEPAEDLPQPKKKISPIDVMIAKNADRRESKLQRELRRHETAPACLDMPMIPPLGDRLTRAEANEIAIANGWPVIGIGPERGTGCATHMEVSNDPEGPTDAENGRDSPELWRKNRWTVNYLESRRAPATPPRATHEHDADDTLRSPLMDLPDADTEGWAVPSPLPSPSKDLEIANLITSTAPVNHKEHKKERLEKKGKNKKKKETKVKRRILKKRPAAAQRIKILKKKPAAAPACAPHAGPYLRAVLKNENSKPFMQVQLCAKGCNDRSVMCIRNTDLELALADAKRIISFIDATDVNVKINFKNAWKADHLSDC